MNEETINSYKEETVWRLTENDFRMVIEEEFPDLSDDQIEKLIDKAHERFSVFDWSDYVKNFIDAFKDEV